MSLIVLAFSFCRSIQNCNFPSFFQNNTTALAHGLLEVLIAPTSSISWMCTFTSSYIPGGMHLYHSLNGTGSYTLMECLTIDVLPKSKSSWEKMQANSRIKSQAAFCNEGYQSFIPDKLSFCRISFKSVLMLSEVSLSVSMDST